MNIYSRLLLSNFRVFILLTLISFSLLSGCVNYRANYVNPRYGIAAPDIDPASGNKSIVAIPSNAPSISQGYKPIEIDKEPGEMNTDHPGIDIVAAKGTFILAAADGIVMRSRFEPMFGHQITISHDQLVDGKPTKTNYAHLSNRRVTRGQKVSQGDIIGELGSTGLLATFLHLHFEVRKKVNGLWAPVSPNQYWLNGARNVTCYSENRVSNDTEPSRFTITYPVKCGQE